MQDTKFVRLLFFTFICYFLSMTSAWADPHNPSGVDDNLETHQIVESATSPDTQAANPDSVLETHQIVESAASPDTQAANPETIHEDDHLVEPIATEDNGESASEDELEGFKSWQKGFDIRLHVGLGAMIADGSEMTNFFEALTDQEMSSAILGYFSGHFNLELGYRWTYAGIYLKFGVSPTLAYDTVMGENREEKKVSKCLLWPDIILLGKFYIPLVDNWEFVIDAGFAFSSVLILYTGVGAQWHLGDMSLGFEVIYERAIASFFIWQFNVNLIAGTFVIGYTF